MLRELGLTATSGAAIRSVRRRAESLGADFGHIVTGRPPVEKAVRPTSKPVEIGCTDVRRLARAGSLYAAAWYTLSGCEVSWPLEPNRYDLIVFCGDADALRVQVKTTTVRVRRTWKVYISTGGASRRAYSPDEIDEFFVIDGELNCYRIPVSAVAGLLAIHLSAYREYRVSSPFSARSGFVRSVGASGPATD
ncbi:hypothetical protein [Gordonia neofelifaecis]|uniref:hypothetical protein n=1 Tax=Gordonia neofelifaecis TaxID=945692 RepID=UPI001111B477|nr:hypothetical protein [Gordonia neofelifaecis]